MFKVLCIIPVPIVRWVLVAAAFGLSGYFLVRNVYPILATVRSKFSSLTAIVSQQHYSNKFQAESKAARLLVVIVAILHAALALSFKFLFFSYYVVHEIGIQDPYGEQPATDPTTAARAAMFKW